MTSSPVKIKDRLPSFIGINTTHVCNLKCVYCPYHSRKLAKGIPAVRAPNFMLNKGIFGKQITKLWQFYEENGESFSINFSGLGEPFLNPHLIPMMEKARSLSIPFSVVSNFSLPAAPYIERCIDLGIKAINTNLDGGNKREYEETRPGSCFETTLANIEKASSFIAKKQSATSLNLHFIITPQNIHSLKKVIKIAHDLGIKNFFAKMVVEMEYSTDGLFFKDFESQNEIFGIIKEGNKLAEKVGINFNQPLYSAILTNLHKEPLEDILTKPVPCWTAFDCMWLNFGQIQFTERELLGNMSLCCPLRRYKKYMFGNIHNDSLWKIINNHHRLHLMKALHEKKFPARCKNCEYNYLRIYKTIAKKIDRCAAACNRGEMELYSGHPDRAHKNFKDALSHDHCSPQANFGLARSLEAMGKYRDALYHIEKALIFRNESARFVRAKEEIKKAGYTNGYENTENKLSR